MNSKQLKFCVVGDDRVGKTSLIMRFSIGDISEEEIPPVYDNCVKTVLYQDEMHVSIGLWDTTNSQKHMTRLSGLAYPETNVFLIVFSLLDFETLERVEERWFPEVRQHVPEASVILVGNKMELRDSDTYLEEHKPEKKPVSTKEGRKVAEKLDIPYFECSSITGDGVEDLFMNSIHYVLEEKDEESTKKTGCTIL